MEIFVGTSGWSNPMWNPDGLAWYQKHSRLNAIELNMSFYHLPEKEQIYRWVQEGKELLWSVKVDRAVTHLFRFNSVAKEKFTQFKELFSPLDPLIAQYLFQLPPHTHPVKRTEIENFIKFANLGSRFALEWRHPQWFSPDHFKWAADLGITIISSDSHVTHRDIINSNGTVYLRLHGRSDWFEHHYAKNELSSIARSIKSSGCQRVMAFLDNDSSQLKNAKSLLSLLKESSPSEKASGATK